MVDNFGDDYELESEEDLETRKIPIKAYFFCTRFLALSLWIYMFYVDFGFLIVA